MEVLFFVIFYPFMAGVCYKILSIWMDDKEDPVVIFGSMFWVLVMPGFIGYKVVDYIYNNIFK